MQIDIISPGKFKENPPYSQIFNYYKKRIKMKINLVETKIYNFENINLAIKQYSKSGGKILIKF